VGSADARGVVARAWVSGEAVMRDPVEREGERDRALTNGPGWDFKFGNEFQTVLNLICFKSGLP
jgi:hypothetical protein